MADNQDEKFSEETDEEETDEDQIGKEQVGEGLKEVRIKLQRIRSQRDFPIAAVQPVRVSDSSDHVLQPKSIPPRPTLVIKQSTANLPRRTLLPSKPATDPSRDRPSQSQSIAQSLPGPSKPINAPSQLRMVSSQPTAVPLRHRSVSFQSKAVQTDASFYSRYGLIAMQRASGSSQRTPVRPAPNPDPQPATVVELSDSSRSSTSSPENDPPAPRSTIGGQGGANACGLVSQHDQLTNQISNAMSQANESRFAFQQHQSNHLEHSCGCCPATGSSAQLPDHSRDSRAGGSELPSRPFVMQEYPTSGQTMRWPQADIGNNCFPDQYIFQSTAPQRQQRQYAGTDTSASLPREHPRQTFVYAANSVPQERTQQYGNGGARNQYRYTPYTRTDSVQMINRGPSYSLTVPDGQNCNCPYYEGFLNNIPHQGQCTYWPAEMERAGSHQATRPCHPSAQNICIECTLWGPFCPRHNGDGNAY